MQTQIQTGCSLNLPHGTMRRLVSWMTVAVGPSVAVAIGIEQHLDDMAASDAGIAMS